MYENLERHESYGKISIHRIQNGNAKRLFGSDVKHHNTIQIEIKQCSVDRHLNEEWYYGENILAEIELSPVQFAEAITNMNTEGVPCTIRYINGKNIDNPPEILNKKEIFRKEFKEDLDKISNNLQESINAIQESISSKKPLNKSQKELVLNNLYKLQQDLNSNMPYMAEKFDEQMDKSISHGKAEIEAYVQNKITSLGLEKLQDIKNGIIKLED